MGTSISQAIGKRQTQGFGCLIAFGLLFAVIGAGIFFMTTVRPAYMAAEARSWQEVPCRIVSSSLKEHSSDDSTTYSVSVDYAYEVKERAYHGTRYSFDSSSGNYQIKKAIVDRLEPGSDRSCWVDPLDPSQAVLDREDHFTWMNVVGSAAFSGFGLMFAGIGYAAYRKAKLPIPAAISARRSMGRRMTAPTVAARGEMVELKTNMGVSAVALVLFAIVWNGFIWTFLSILWSKRDLSICPMMFLGLFAVIGAILAVAAVRRVMQSFVPRPVLRASAATPIGGQLQLRWEYRRATAAIQSMSLMLVGREEATYQRGTTTTTDKSEFARIPIHQATGWPRIATGSVTVQIPPGTMHSFTAPRNKIVWAIELVEVVSNWPDVKCEYSVTIAPQAKEGIQHG